ncbi:hypothetical protein BCR42DRAFT_374349 [Absidia repens]|uniref:SWI5-dependent HO expression protein 3 n=1 Tax=Absidia repens TaxID=90262 RepID=A0A1X2IK84_9FUNG|nr:hypothetical protein BCR42DRAFT_374349 [Absidia repens]
MMTLAPATPQPSKSSSNSRSNRVIEELQETWDTLQKDLVTIKAQLDSAREAKKNNEQQSKEYVQSNQECRIHIQELMELLESKQQSLDLTKQQSVELENQVKQLKTDALTSRKHLDDLKKRETQLGQDRDAAVLAKARVEQQQKVLQQSIQDMDNRFIKEQQMLKKELDTIQRQLEQVSTRNQLIAEMMVANVENETEARQELIRQVGIQQKDYGQATGLFVDRIRSELQTLLDEATSLGYLSQEVKQCQDEVNGLVQRIQSYSMVLQ